MRGGVFVSWACGGVEWWWAMVGPGGIEGSPSRTSASQAKPGRHKKEEEEEDKALSHGAAHTTNNHHHGGGELMLH